MDTRPPKLLGFFLGLIFISVLTGVIAWSVIQMGAGELSIWLALWVVLPLISLPVLFLVVYRLYGLGTARYHIDRDGFRLRWGLAFEDIPIQQLTRVDRAEAFNLQKMPGAGAWWPGLVVGKRQIENLGEVEYYATSGPADMVVVQYGERFLAITPRDVEAFLKAVTDSLRMGALSIYEPVSTRPNFALARLGSDRAAVLLVILGGLLPIALFGYLLLIVGEITGQVAFGFDASGAVDTLAPPGRLLLLPMIAGASWFLDLFFGMWMYRTNANRPLAYTLWGGAIIVGGLMWGAVLQLLGVI
jgi:hypothetical protein